MQSRHLCWSLVRTARQPASFKDDINQQGVLAVRIIYLSVLTIAALGLSAIMSAQAQSPSPTVGTRIAVIDISTVFKNHEGFKAEMEKMKQDVQAFEATLKASGKKLEGMRDQLRTFKVGSSEHKALEKRMAQTQAEIQIETQVKRKDFLEYEAQIYYGVYEEVVDEVAKFSQRHSISLVVRFNSGDVDPMNRKSILEAVNRPVVFQQNLNITKNILDRVNRASTAVKPVPGTTR